MVTFVLKIQVKMCQKKKVKSEKIDFFREIVLLMF